MLAALLSAYADPDAEVAAALAAGRRPVRTLGFDAPRTRLIAAGFQPVRLVAPRLAATPRADTIMGAAEIGPRGRRLLEALVAPVRPEVPVLITQADSEQPQIFAALRELGRLGEPVPEQVHFCDLLHIDRASSRAYNATRLAQLDDWLVSLGGRRPTVESLAEAEALLAEQAALLERCDALRREGRIAGSDMLALIGACAILPVDRANAALVALLEAPVEIAAHHPTPTPLTLSLSKGAGATVAPGASTSSARAESGLVARRVLVCGTPHEGAELYQAIEAAGAQVVGEAHAWGLAHAVPPRVASPSAEARRVAEAALAAEADLVLHLTLDGDEAAPWDVARLKRALPENLRFAALRCSSIPDAAFAETLTALLTGQAIEKPAAAPKPATGKPRPSPSRSRKSLSSVADVNAYQREWFASVRQQVAEGAPFAMVNANAPQEILRALDIPFVVNQWWASIVAAKQQSRRYQGLLRAHDYPADVEAYSAQGLAAAFDDDADHAPWGGLPRPDFVHAVASSDPTLKLFEQWGEDVGAESYVYERTTDPRADLFADWWAQLPAHWDSVLEDERVDLMLAEIREVIARLEARTGRTFSAERFAEVMTLVNEQEEYYRKTRDLVARTVPAPIGVVDSMPATMVPQWHRGTVWARDAAKDFYEEVQARVDAGLAAVPNERVRLMWVGRGLWSEMGFYQKWEESHGAVFVWSMYLALAADGYIRDLSGGRDPLRALASRVICMGDELRMPTWAGPWHVHEAQTHSIDGVVALQDADPFVVRALRAAGFPVLELTADNFNRESEDGAAIDAAITAFVEGPARERAEQRHAGT
ncbi:2-hydroxyacyl-CoA dehydratase family protein [Novosphingobium sp. PS1R-30]|uniref:2-hydroxyacyl-CoA dehydratase family protein n=1 Tax=Novosphingobium anseongense TaxID=3133436 RepID=A0ABU8RYV2_9SPHN